MEILFENNFDELIETAWANFFAAFPMAPSYMGTPEETKPYGLVYTGGGKTEHGEAVILYDPETNHPYEMLVRSVKDNESYRWVHPAYYRKRTELVGYHNPSTTLSPLDVEEKWHETESIEDIIDKIEKILRGEEHDHKVVIVLDLEEQHIAFYDKLAEKKGITRDEAIEFTIRKELTKLDKKAFPNGHPDSFNP